MRLASHWHGLTAACSCSLQMIVINDFLLNLCFSFVNTLFSEKVGQQKNGVKDK